jgi:two-component system OmpR family response regulator
MMQQSNTARLVVVDDEADIRGMVADYFVQEGYQVSPCANGREMDAALAESDCDLVVLDVSMPGEDGLSIARRLKAQGSTPIIMLSALDDILDRVVGLEVGADDYVTKPFDLRELRSRIRAVLRRGRPAVAAPKPAAASSPGRNLAPFGKVWLDLDKQHLIDADGTQYPLTPTEFELLATFARNPNRVLSRDQMVDPIEARDPSCLDRAIDIRVTRIRKKVERDPANPRVIRTVRGVGYIYVPPHATS